MKIEKNENLITVSNNERKINVEFLGVDTIRIFEEKVRTDLIELSIKKSKKNVDLQGNSISYKGFKLVLTENSIAIFKNEKEVVTFNFTTGEYNQKRFFESNFAVEKDSFVYGLGDKMAPLNHKGYFYRQWNTDDSNHQDELFQSLYKSINFLLVHSNGCYFGMFYPSTYPYELDICKSDLNKVFVRNFYAQNDFFLFLGETPKEIISNYSTLVGHPYMVRLKMLGNNQSRWSYKNEKEVLAVLDGYRKNNIPLDYIHFDIHYLDGYRDFTVDKERFPNMQELTGILKKNHIDAIPINDSGIKLDPDYKVYDFCKKNNLISTHNGEDFVGVVWPGDSIFPKYYSKEARKFFGEEAYKFVQDNGFSGIWNDMNEPVSFKGELPEDVDFSIKGRKLAHIEEHNVYGEHMIRCLNDVFTRDNIRPYLFSRACFATTPKYAFVWNGDNFSLWHHLRLSISQILSMSISGNMFNGCDVGGFGGDSNKQLLIRWMQAHVLMPFVRNHSTLDTKAQEPYAYDRELMDIYTHYLNIRYELVPYLYNLVEKMNKNGEPIVRPMFYNYPDDARALTINDQYMAGEDIMVAPVLDQDVFERIVYFPKGKWIDYETRETYVGGKSYIVKMPLGKTGIYVRNNTVLPCFEGLTYIEKDEIETIVFKLFGTRGNCTLYEDDGVSMNYKKGEYNLYRVAISNDNLTLKCSKNSYKTPFKYLKVVSNNGEKIMNFKDCLK